MAEYKKILVALDRSPLTATVFDTALTQARAMGAELLLLSCITLPGTTSLEFGDRYRGEVSTFLDVAQRQITEEMEAIRQWLSGLESEAQEAGVNVHWDWRMGDAGPHICHIAETWGADLIITGRHNRGGLAEAFLGSVSNYVMHRAKCAVLVVPG